MVPVKQRRATIMEKKEEIKMDKNYKDPNCAYCAKGDLVNVFGYEVCELPASVLYVFRDQTHPGRCIVASKFHVSEMRELTAEERAAFIEDVNTAAEAIHAEFHPDKINYGMYGDTGHHLHCHLVPKYKDQEEWGSTFAMNYSDDKLNDAGCEIIAEKLRAHLPK